MKTKIDSDAPKATSQSIERHPYLFRLVLAAATLVGFLIRWHVGRKTYIDFDEWQHLFMAGVPRWSDLSFELRTNAHPPLFFLLLRGFVRLGNLALYRSISIAAGTGSIVVVGLIAKRILRSPIVQLLCAAAFALSAAAIFISIEIRSYQLTVFLMLVAFWAWLSLFSQTDRRTTVRSCFTFAICSSLAVSSHYSAVFFLGACAAVPLTLAIILPGLRKEWISGMQKEFPWPAFAAFALPCAVFAIEYVVHIRHQLMQGYAAEFYRGGTPGETVVAFVVRNSRNFFNLFSPIEFHSAAPFFIALLLVCAAAVWVLFGRSRAREGGVLYAAPILFAVVVVMELLAASLAQKYPFGGMLRHQYIAAPFLLIASFVLVDALVSSAGPILRRAVPIVLAAAITVNLIAEWPKLIVYPGLVLEQDEFNTWRSAFADKHAVYLDHWAVIGFFIHTRKLPRRFVRRIADPAWIDQYHLPDGTEIFYDKSRDSLDLLDSSVYQSFADCIRGSGINELTLFFFSPGNRPLAQAPPELEKSIIQKASEQGLITTKVIAGRTAVYAGFRLKPN